MITKKNVLLFSDVAVAALADINTKVPTVRCRTLPHSKLLHFAALYCIVLHCTLHTASAKPTLHTQNKCCADRRVIEAMTNACH